MEYAAKVTDLHKSFGRIEVLHGIDLELKRGTITGLVGRNGSGKTVMMKCLCGLVPYTSGTVEINGKIIGKDVEIPDGIGVIIETPGFLGEYSGYRNLKFLADISGKADKTRVRSALNMVGLDPDSRKHVARYSLGMRQRLGLAQAIMEDPDILILDEPMNGLDNDGVADMRGYLSDLRSQGKTILLASHSHEDIDVLCDTVYEMDKGRLTKIR